VVPPLRPAPRAAPPRRALPHPRPHADERERAGAGAQALWLERAAALEFTGASVLRALWARGLVYVAANAWVLGEVLRAYCA
jgi:hypothetical protein